MVLEKMLALCTKGLRDLMAWDERVQPFFCFIFCCFISSYYYFFRTVVMAERWKTNISCSLFIGKRKGQARVQNGFKTHTHDVKAHLENMGWGQFVLMFFLEAVARTTYFQREVNCNVNWSLACVACGPVLASFCSWIRRSFGALNKQIHQLCNKWLSLNISSN